LEARRFAYLDSEQKAGRISGLELQPRFPIVINGIKICSIVGDFAYVRDGTKITEDAKGTDLPMSKLKRKLAAAVLGITIEVVK
jgi:hypothetical protein